MLKSARLGQSLLTEYFVLLLLLMKRRLINQRVLMSAATFFDDASAINPYMDDSVAVDKVKAQAEHDAIREALIGAGVEVITTNPPINCQDGVYTANWALVRGDVAVMASLPLVRQPELIRAREALEAAGKRILDAPKGLRFSGQGDALPCGDYLFCGSKYRTDEAVYPFLEETLGYKVINLQTIPALDEAGNATINLASGWPDSFFYDIDLALSIITPELIAWCPEAFTTESQAILRDVPIEKIEVSLEEATKGFACNLVSTGETVIMSSRAPSLQAELNERGFKTITPVVTELGKGGGYIRCTTLTLDNS